MSPNRSCRGCTHRAQRRHRPPPPADAPPGSALDDTPSSAPESWPAPSGAWRPDAVLAAVTDRGPVTTVDRSSPLPACYQVAQDLRRLEQREWQTGDRITPELELADAYGVSRVTIRQALAELVKDELLERKPGSGTYVRPLQQPIVWDLNLTLGAYAARIRELGFTNRAEILESGLIDAPPEHLRAALDIEPGGQVAYLLRRVLINEQPANDLPVVVRCRRRSGIERSAGVAGSLSDTLKHEYGFVPVRSEQSLEVVRSTREEALLLAASSDAPLLVVTSTSNLGDGRALEHARMVWLGDRVRFHVTSGAS